MYIEVLIELKAKSLDKTFTYSVPENLKSQIQKGKRVYVPFGKQKIEGFILDIKNNFDNSYDVKDIIDVIDEEVIINDEMLNLGTYISKKTLCTLISAYQTMLPSALKAHHNFKINKKYETYLKLINKNIELKSEKQKEVYCKLCSKELVLKKECTSISNYIVKTFIEKGYIKEVKKEIYRHNFDDIKEPCQIILNEEQTIAVNKVTATNGFRPYLLHGVTGSGKTETYMHIVSYYLNINKSAIVLVPEISLTPQTVLNFRKRFGSSIAILHSGLSNGEKYDEYRKILKGEVHIVIGARSAIFAPLTNIGVIIIDEEHSSTYKQDNTPKYSAIDVAIYRSKFHKCPLVLGSATPSVESYTRAKNGIYELITLKKRVNNNLPNVKLIDMKNEIKKGNKYFSNELTEAINNCLEKNEQIILLLNRRGFSTISTCNSCGYVHKCKNCDIPLVYHKTSNTMRCHYCGYGSSKLLKCPKCGCHEMFDYGMGTEKLEEIVRNIFPKARPIRMDIDTTSIKGAHEKILSDFQKLKYNILIGTQMIAKGLDFKMVTLVGVINGDSSLNIPDFRSGERTFQLLNQVAGRAGRAEKSGKVIIQGFNIDHYSIIFASNNDYIGFYNEEMRIRKILGYPPYFNLCVIKIKSKNETFGLNEGKKIVTYLKNNLDNSNIVLGPSITSKINNYYNIQIIIKFKKTNTLLDKLVFINNLYLNKGIIIDIDLNPYKI